MTDVEQTDASSLAQMNLLDTILLQRVVHDAEEHEHRLQSETSAAMLVRLLAQMPQREIHAVHGPVPLSLVRSLATGFIGMIPLRQDIFTPDLADVCLERRISAQAVAFRKISDDERDWSWNCRF